MLLEGQGAQLLGEVDRVGVGGGAGLPIAKALLLLRNHDRNGPLTE